MVGAVERKRRLVKQTHVDRLPLPVKIGVRVPTCLNELKGHEMHSRTQLDRITRPTAALAHPIHDQLTIDEEPTPVV